MYELKDNCIVKTGEFPEDMTYEQALAFTRELWHTRTLVDYRQETGEAEPNCALCFVDDDCIACPAWDAGCSVIASPYLNNPTRANARKVVAAIDKYMEDNP